MSDWNAQIIDEFRSNEGKVGGMFAGRPLLLLHTTGARTGNRRIVPLMYRQEGDTLYVFASKAGADSHPDWYYNLKANPQVTVEVGTETRQATAKELDRDERDPVFEAMAAEWSNFAEYQEATDRVIPVFALT